MHTSKRAAGRQLMPGRGAGCPIAVVRAAVGLFLLVLVGSAGLCGCSAPSSDSSPELLVPSVFYVSRDPRQTSEFTIEEKRAGHFTVTFDARDLQGVAVLKAGMDICPVHLPTFRCGGDQVGPRHGGSRQAFRVSPADGAMAGASAVLRYRLTAPGLPSVTASTRLVVGRSALVVETHADRRDVDPGGRVAASLTLRNTGDVPARGVALFIDTHDGLKLADRHRNCRYNGSTSAWCRLSADDVVIPPGASYHLAAPEVFTVADDATYPTATFDASGIGQDYVPPEEITSQFEPGKGSALRYVPGAAPDDGNDDGKGDSKGDGQDSEESKGETDGKDAGAPRTTDRSAGRLKVDVRNTSDLVAVAGTARGPVGSRADVEVGVRNDGPGALPAPVKVEFTVPAGTTVVSSPYDPERSEEVIDQACRALATNGTTLTTAFERQPSARRYVCTAQAGKVGATTTFNFTLRIDKDLAHRGGRVTVADADSEHPSKDPKPADDTAEQAVTVWPGPAWATPGLCVSAGIALGVLLLTGALVTRRRRHSR